MRNLALLPVLPLVILGAGCASAPPIHYRSMQNTEVSAWTATAHCVVQIDPITLPPAYDRNEIVVNSGPHELAWSSSEQWSAPLPDVLAARLAATLARTLRTRQVYIWPSALEGAADVNIRMQVQRIDATPGGQVAINAIWALDTSKAKSIRGAAAATGQSNGPGYAPMVIAAGDAVDALAISIAQEIHKLGVCQP